MWCCLYFHTSSRSITHVASCLLLLMLRLSYSFFCFVVVMLSMMLFNDFFNYRIGNSFFFPQVGIRFHLALCGITLNMLLLLYHCVIPNKDCIVSVHLTVKLH